MRNFSIALFALIVSVGTPTTKAQGILGSLLSKLLNKVNPTAAPSMAPSNFPSIAPSTEPTTPPSLMPTYVIGGTNASCDDSDACKADYRRLFEFSDGLDDCKCDRCSDQYSFTLTCDLCVGCSEEADLCADVKYIHNVIAAGRNNFTFVRFTISGEVNGSDSASTHVVAEFSRNFKYYLVGNNFAFDYEAAYEFVSEAKVSIDGVVCQDYYIENNCEVIDCRNVPNGELYACEDIESIRFNRSHPLYVFDNEDKTICPGQGYDQYYDDDYYDTTDDTTSTTNDDSFTGDDDTTTTNDDIPPQDDDDKGMAYKGFSLLGQLVLPLLSTSYEDGTETAGGDLPLLNRNFPL
ncbi:hypothetical protein FisN_32Hu080 [Fistulifera solaris]|uniref:Uncharacterized protein n=1 Tax=Fistulifera solaris TaxID=1519565 RepID=A0A1Z5K3N9_FISSO|nr:hypothetical protein FisN_32Hu080 [Fistulifera solaris]|eukprot:GAX20691.1 hypothetical protein FisN_32Hu080 [Fistulifera solaris]